MKLRVLSLSLVLLPVSLAAQPASGNSSNGQRSDAVSEEAPQNPDDRVVCRRMATSGSRVNADQGRVCMTVREWREHRLRGNR